MNIASTKKSPETKRSWFHSPQTKANGKQGTTPAVDIRDVFSLTASTAATGFTAAAYGAQVAAGDYSSIGRLFVGAAAIGGVSTAAGSRVLQYGTGKILRTDTLTEDEKLDASFGGILLGGIAGAAGVALGMAGADPLAVGLVTAGVTAGYLAFDKSSFKRTPS